MLTLAYLHRPFLESFLQEPLISYRQGDDVNAQLSVHARRGKEERIAVPEEEGGLRPFPPKCS